MPYKIKNLPSDLLPGLYPSHLENSDIDGDDTIHVVYDPNRTLKETLIPIQVGV